MSKFKNSLLLALSSFFIFSVAHAERIVVIGDSHSCGDFGKQLVKELGNSGKNHVVMYCAGGLSVQHFLTGFTPKRPANNCKTYSSTQPRATICEGTGRVPALKEILAKEKPDRVVPALGTNNLGLNALTRFAPFAKQIKESGAKCHWVGPPVLGTNGRICREYGHNLEKVISTIGKSIAGTCRYVDSRNHTNANSTPDCIHRYGGPARSWADGVAREINRDTKEGSPRPKIQNSINRVPAGQDENQPESQPENQDENQKVN